MIFDILIGVVKIILMPIDFIILGLLPDLSNTMTAFGDFLTIVSSAFGWVLSATGIPFATISLVITFYIFKLSTPIIFWFVKIIIKWVNVIRGSS